MLSLNDYYHTRKGIYTNRALPFIYDHQIIHLSLHLYLTPLNVISNSLLCGLTDVKMKDEAFLLLCDYGMRSDLHKIQPDIRDQV